MPARNLFDASPYTLLNTAPNLLEWVCLTPLGQRDKFAARAEMLLKDAPTAGAVVLRVMLAERRLGLWAIRAERARRSDKKMLIEALRELTAAERDATRSWSDYVKERDRAPAAPAAGGYVDLLGIEGEGDPPVSAVGVPAA